MDGIAVIDVETTGLFPGRDRVVELGIVHLDRDGRMTGRWELSSTRVATWAPSTSIGFVRRTFSMHRLSRTSRVTCATCWTGD